MKHKLEIKKCFEIETSESKRCRMWKKTQIENSKTLEIEREKQ